MHAPVVEGYRHVEQQAIDAGKVEIDHAADAVALEQHVVAEQVGMDGPARQILAPVPRLKLEFRAQERGALGIEERAHLGSGFAPPAWPAWIVEPARIGLAGEMYVGECAADVAALRRRGRRDRFSLQARDQRRRLAVQLGEQPAVDVGRRRRAGNAMLRQVRHQSEIERQFDRRELLEQRQDVAPAGGGDEVVRVLDARGDALHLHQGADAIVLQPNRKLLGRDLSEDRHAGSG